VAEGEEGGRVNKRIKILNPRVLYTLQQAYEQITHLRERETREHLAAANGPDWYYHWCGETPSGIYRETILNEVIA
jgi:hypothetical protein